MDISVPYMPSVKNLHSILDKIQHAAVPDAFGYDFLHDLGFTSSNDRSIVKLFKYLGFLDSSGRPQTSYRDFVDHTKTKIILAERLRSAFDDLYVSNKKAHEMTVDQLKGWFKSKTGKGDSVAIKIATTFKTLADYADFSTALPKEHVKTKEPEKLPPAGEEKRKLIFEEHGLGLVYRFEIHLPDTQNIDTFRAIFRAMREELMQ
jgi:hypothetical protein